jgi:aminopeptidase S
VVSGTTATTVFTQAGAASNRAAAWQTATVNLSAYAGQSIRLQVEAADLSTASLVEAAVDDIKITQG